MVFPVIEKGTICNCHAVVSTVKLFWPFADFIEILHKIKYFYKNAVLKVKIVKIFLDICICVH